MATITLDTVVTTTITELIDTTNSAVVFTHPVVGYILSDFWTTEELQTAASLQAAMTAGNVVVKRDGVIIKSLGQIPETPSPMIETLATTATILPTTDVVVFTGIAAQTLTLPTPAGHDGKIIKIKQASANDVLLTTATGTIDGYTSVNLIGNTLTTLSVMSDGTDWRAV